MSDDYFLYAKRDEGDALATVDALLSQQRCIAEYPASVLLQWFHQDAHETKQTMNLRHFVVLLRNDVIDIIALSEPKMVKI